METKETKGEIVLRKFLKDKLEEIKPLGQNVVSVAAQNLQKKLLDQMCRLDALFRVMYKDNKIQGSVKKSLKVGNPDEFDLDLCLKLPIADPRVIQIQEHKDFPSWFHCTFPKVAWIWPVPRSRQRRAWRKLFTEYAEDSKVVHLRADSVRSWLQGLVHRAIKSHEELRQINIKETRSGPAITLVFAIEATEVSMDLVAALEIPEESWSPDFSGKYEGVKTSSFLIPVAPRVPLHSPPPPSNLLRGSFPELEEHLLKGQDSLKDNIRLLKIVRSNNKWNPIASFFITNICTNWCQEEGNRTKGMTESNLGDRFISFLEEMESALRQKSLPMTIFPDCELFVRLTPEFCLNVANRLRTIIRRLKHCVKRQNKEHMTHVLRILFAPGTRYYEDDPILNLSATTP